MNMNVYKEDRIEEFERLLSSRKPVNDCYYKYKALSINSTKIDNLYNITHTFSPIEDVVFVVEFTLHLIPKYAQAHINPESITVYDTELLPAKVFTAYTFNYSVSVADQQSKSEYIKLIQKYIPYFNTDFRIYLLRTIKNQILERLYKVNDNATLCMCNIVVLNDPFTFPENTNLDKSVENEKYNIKVRNPWKSKIKVEVKGAIYDNNDNTIGEWLYTDADYIYGIIYDK